MHWIEVNPIEDTNNLIILDAECESLIKKFITKKLLQNE